MQEEITEIIIKMELKAHLAQQVHKVHKVFKAHLDLRDRGQYDQHLLDLRDRGQDPISTCSWTCGTGDSTDQHLLDLRDRGQDHQHLLDLPRDRDKTISTLLEGPGDRTIQHLLDPAGPGTVRSSTCWTLRDRGQDHQHLLDLPGTGDRTISTLLDLPRDRGQDHQHLLDPAGPGTVRSSTCWTCGTSLLDRCSTPPAGPGGP